MDVQLKSLSDGYSYNGFLALNKTWEEYIIPMPCRYCGVNILDLDVFGEHVSPRV